MGQVQVLDHPEALPNACAVCGGGKVDGRKYVDIGLSLDYYGVVYLCGPCFNQIVRAIGAFISVAEYKSLEQWVIFYRDKCEILTQKVGVLNDIVGGIESLRDINNSIVGTDDNRPAGQDPTDKEPINLSFGDVEGEGSTDSQSNGQTSIGRLENVPSFEGTD
jgi:hypothetical protein